MVNDKEVKTAISPFAVRQDEKKVYDGKEGFAKVQTLEEFLFLCRCMDIGLSFCYSQGKRWMMSCRSIDCFISGSMVDNHSVLY